MTANLLRTTLSLLGIAVGIFSIISVYAVVDSLERSIRQSVQGLGTNVVYVQKWPWGGGGGEYPWWKYFQRPEVSYEDYQRLSDFAVRGSDAIVLTNGTSATVTRANSSVEQVEVRGITYDYAQLNNLKVTAQHAYAAAYRVKPEHQAVGNVNPNEAAGQPTAKFPVGEVASARKLQVIELGVVIGYASNFDLLHA